MKCVLQVGFRRGAVRPSVPRRPQAPLAGSKTGAVLLRTDRRQRPKPIEGAARRKFTGWAPERRRITDLRRLRGARGERFDGGGAVVPLRSAHAADARAGWPHLDQAAAQVEEGLLLR